MTSDDAAAAAAAAAGVDDDWEYDLWKTWPLEGDWDIIVDDTAPVGASWC